MVAGTLDGTREQGGVRSAPLSIPGAGRPRAADSTYPPFLRWQVGRPSVSLANALRDRYMLERELGRGGMATVYLAHDLRHDRKVALKVVHPELAATLGPERFLREIRLTAKLSHPHILPVLDSGEASGQLWYTMPYVEGKSVRDRLQREVQLPIDDAVRIAREVAGALDYAQRHGVVHRDVKPENILLEDDQAVLADFGVAKALSDAGGQLTGTGLSVGTPAYMSPEQASGASQIDGRSDIYSLGCVLYEMLAGEPPFTGPTAQVIVAKRFVDPVPMVRRLREAVPSVVEAAIARSLARVPADRFETPGQFAAALGLMSPAPVPPTPNLPRGESLTISDRLRRGVAIAALLAVGAWAIWQLWPRYRQEETGSRMRSLPDAGQVAVLYFDSPEKDEELRYLADGLTESLIYELAQVKGLRVVSRNGAALYRELHVPRDGVARALGVGTLIEGTLERHAAVLRTTLRLVDGLSGAEFQRASIEEPLRDLLALRDTLAREAARFLRARLGQEIRLRQQQRGTRDVDAWVLLQRAEKVRKDSEAQVGRDSVSLVVRHFLRADTLAAAAESRDRRWSEPAVFRAAIAYRLSQLDYDPIHAAPWIQVAKGHVNRALALDAENSDGLELRGTLLYWSWLLRLTRDSADAARAFAEAKRDLEQAVAIRPSQAGAWATLSHLYMQTPDLVQAKLAAQRAYEEDTYLRNTDLVIWRLFTCSTDLEQYSDARRWCNEGVRRFPANYRFVQCRLWLMKPPSGKPDISRAWRLVDSVAALAPAGVREFHRRKAQIVVAELLTVTGLADSARNVLDRSKDHGVEDPNRELPYDEAYVRALLGDRDKAVELLKSTFAVDPNRRVDLQMPSWRRVLGNDPRFKVLLRGA